MNARLSGIKKIAVLRANALGDFIFVLPALRALRETYPQAEIVYLGKPWHKAFLASRPSPVDRVVVIPVSRGVRGNDETEDDHQELQAFFTAMQAEQFDMALQLHGGGHFSNPFLLQLGAQLSVGLRTPEAALLDRWVPYVYYHSEILRYLEVVTLVGATTDEIEPQLCITPEDRTEAQTGLKGSPHPFIVIHPGATDLKRRWPAENFALVGDVFAEKGYTIFVTGTREEQEIVSAVIHHMKQKGVSLCGQVSLRGLAGLLSHASLVISNDTGPLHLAGAVGAKTVGLYWCGNLINGTPMTRTRHRPLLSWQVMCPLCDQDIASNYPFEKNGNSCEHRISFVSSITPQEVITAAEDLLSQKV